MVNCYCSYWTFTNSLSTLLSISSSPSCEKKKMVAMICKKQNFTALKVIAHHVSIKKLGASTMITGGIDTREKAVRSLLNERAQIRHVFPIILHSSFALLLIFSIVLLRKALVFPSFYLTYCNALIPSCIFWCIMNETFFFHVLALSWTWYMKVPYPMSLTIIFL